MVRTFIVILALACASLAQAAPEERQARASGSQKSKQPTPKLLSAALASATEDMAAESDLLQLANRSRRQAGVPPLRWNEDLVKAARSHARLMISQGKLSHQFDGEPSLLRRLHDTGIALNSVGENVAYHSSAEQVFDALMHSPPHRANLLDPDFNAAGFAAIWSEGRLYVVQDFVRQVPEIAPATQRSR